MTMNVTYTEDNQTFQVTVVSETSDDEAWRFRLRRLDNGEEFTFMKRKDNSGWFGMGVLRMDDGRTVPDNVYQIRATSG
jgi:hypothetical protein